MNMRKIKFRAWDVWDKKIIDWRKIYYNKAFNYDFHMGVTGNLIPMQYTGLKDKNGKEIYESDILKWSDWRPNFYENEHLYKYSNKVVNWSQKYGSWILDKEELWNLGIYSNIEIIGNIYENPELLDK